MEPVTVAPVAPVLAESVDFMKAALDAVPPGGRRRQRDRASRMGAYLRFQEAAHGASLWPVWLGIIDQALMDKRMTSAHAVSLTAPCRSDTAQLLAALSTIRLTGNPEPRKLAEEIVTLLVELMEARLPAQPSRSLRLRAAEHLYAKTDMRARAELVAQRLPSLTRRAEQTIAILDQGVRQAQEQRFGDCQLALGTWHRKSTLAARKDLGYGPRPWHVSKRPRGHRWQIWRPHEEWPGGWPPPDASELVSQARAEREARPSPRRMCCAIRSQ
jgi:hypothetical protein